MPNSHDFDGQRNSQLPANWPTIRKKTLSRDNNTCTRCGHHSPGGYDLQVDHIGDRNDHSLDNLRTLCRRCHLKRSASQGARAANAARKRRLKLPEKKHPGGLTP